MSLPTTILSSLTRLTQQPHFAECYLQPIDLAPDETPPWGVGGIGGLSIAGGGNTAVRFQYWPESLQDSKGSEWNPRPVPGGSHPIYQWANGGERTLSFTAIFTTDTAPEESVLELIGPATNDPYATQSLNPLSGLVLGVRDIDIRSAISWLRWFEYPTYGLDGNQQVYPPAKAILVMPNTALGHNGEDHIICAMTTCDVTYEEWFPTGYPRIVEVALEFKELVQSGERVRFHDRRNMELAANVRTYLSATHSVET